MYRRESLWLKFVKNWFGIDGKLDERQLAEVERIGNNAYILSSIAEGMILFISCYFVFTNQITVAYSFLGLATAIILLLSGCYTSFALKRLQIFQVEITPEERPKAVRRIYLKAIVEGIICFIPCMIGAAVGSSIANHGGLVNVLAFWPQGLWISVCICVGTVLGKLHRLKVVKDEKSMN
ncbi:DUF3278 domain-containing protein [Lactobacillus ultunensis]|uniref:DUF3278 domain-containing protein n=1 Tax=Lactobacillus ultunensis DSM 16047 TaxID=525365 RepID=C2EP07_9LACO|nr:DUF3278 domain-containing protein [Lactobacillus ultunensis]EEJ71790.1 hypothetical protein HMPREF0548_1403 [Lactobacillus ultunensis DSM 16047]KRL79724.1 hypothetical protein FC57_GL001917 [Lactobacillus ultunensis DSM 16047]QQP28503.1 DUF3278 domain-containing protein [Lactobacillus ultunensis]